MKVLLLSHIADIDGITPVILGKLTWDDFDYELYESSEINSVVKLYLDNATFDKYDQIYITDLTVNYETAKLINESKWKNNILLFDHHLPSLELNEFEFSKSLVENEGRKVCGTSLFYEYLRNNYSNKYINSPGMKEFVELVRLNDTWDWKIENNIAARDLASLHAIYGNDFFINKYVEFFRKNDDFYFEDKEEFLLTVERKRIRDYIDLKATQLIRGKLLGYSVGFVFAELYRSELGNDLAERYKDEIDFVVIINISRSISFRGIKDINLCEIANVYGGYGHKNAAGCPLPENLREKILEFIFSDNLNIKKDS